MTLVHSHCVVLYVDECMSSWCAQGMYTVCRPEVCAVLHVFLNAAHKLHCREPVYHIAETPQKFLRFLVSTKKSLCHFAVRKARFKDLKHMQDLNVFEVAWSGEVKSIPKVRSKWLRNMKLDAVEARLVAQEIAYGNRGLHQD